MKRVVAAVTVFVTVAACAGCSSSAPTPAPAPGPASGEQLLSSGDLDGDGKDDAVFGVPKSPTVITYSSIRAVAAAGETLLTVTDADGDLAGAVIAQPGAPTPMLVVARWGGLHGGLLTAYLYDTASKQMAPVKWAGNVGKAELNDRGGLDIMEYDGGWSSGPYVYRDGQLAPMFTN
ncbi:MAG: hypothetical protein JWN15_2314 [Firmicutes bacterium]|nr:hypothetical protein [Bacillota bacterium]